MLMKNIHDYDAFVKSLPEGYSSGNPNGSRPQRISEATFSAVTLTLIAIFFTVFGFVVA